MSVLNIPIAKAGKGVTFEVDSDIINNLPPEAFARIVEEGLKVLLNSRMSKLEAPSKLEGAAAEANKQAALEKAEENLNDLVAGKLVKKAAAKATAESREVMTEARRLAKEVVKNEIRKAGMKISHVAAKDITAAANQLLSDDPSYIEQAKLNLAERAEVKATVDIKSIIHESPTLVARAEKAKAEKKSQLSAKQAGLPKSGKVPPRKAMTAAEAEAHIRH